MTELQLIILFSLISGSTVILGGLFSHFFGWYIREGIIKAEIIHISIAFGGGILLAAVFGIDSRRHESTFCNTNGNLFFNWCSFFLFHRPIHWKKGRDPGSIIRNAFGFCTRSNRDGCGVFTKLQTGYLLAVIIGIQNFPEAFNAYLNLKTSYSSKKCLIILFFLSFSGVASALLAMSFYRNGYDHRSANVIFFRWNYLSAFSRYRTLIKVKQKLDSGVGSLSGFSAWDD